MYNENAQNSDATIKITKYTQKIYRKMKETGEYYAEYMNIFA